MKKLGSQGGFTLIELVMVIAIIAILAAAAIPRFIDLRDEARAASEQGVVGGVRAGVAIWRAGYLAGDPAAPTDYPAALDGAAVGPAGVGNEFFDSVLDYGIIDPNWTKAAGDVYTGPAGGTYTYDNTNGSFQ